MATKIFSLLLLVLAAAKSEDRSQKKRGVFGEHQDHNSLGNSFGSGSSSSWKPILPSYGVPSSHYASTKALPAAHDFSAGTLALAHQDGDSGASSHSSLADISAGSLSPIPQPPLDLSSAQFSSASFPSEGLSASSLSHDHSSLNSLSLPSANLLSAFQTADASGLEPNGALLSSGNLSPSFAVGGSSFGGISPALLPSGGSAGLFSNGLPSEEFSSLPTLGVGAPFPIGRHITVTNRVAVPVPQPYPVPVHRDVPYPVHHTVHVPVSRPVPVPVAKPYPVTVIKHVPVTVEKRVPYPVPHPVPYPVYKPVPVPFAKPVPVPVVKDVPYPVAKPYVVYQQQKETSSWR